MCWCDSMSFCKVSRVDLPRQLHAGTGVLAAHDSLHSKHGSELQSLLYAL